MSSPDAHVGQVRLRSAGRAARGPLDAPAGWTRVGAAPSRELSGCGLLSGSPPARVAFNPAAPSLPGAGPARPRCAHASADTVARSRHAHPGLTGPLASPSHVLNPLPPSPGALGCRAQGRPGGLCGRRAMEDLLPRGGSAAPRAGGPSGLGCQVVGAWCLKRPVVAFAQLRSCLGPPLGHWPQAPPSPQTQDLGLCRPHQRHKDPGRGPCCQPPPSSTAFRPRIQQLVSNGGEAESKSLPFSLYLPRETSTSLPLPPPGGTPLRFLVLHLKCPFYLGVGFKLTWWLRGWRLCPQVRSACSALADGSPGHLRLPDASKRTSHFLPKPTPQPQQGQPCLLFSPKPDFSFSPCCFQDRFSVLLANTNQLLLTSGRHPLLQRLPLQLPGLALLLAPPTPNSQDSGLSLTSSEPPSARRTCFLLSGSLGSIRPLLQCHLFVASLDLSAPLLMFLHAFQV